jgi:hypothetical protein
MIPKSVQRFSDKIMLKQEHDPEKACPGLDPGCAAVFGQDHAQTRAGSRKSLPRT